MLGLCRAATRSWASPLLPQCRTYAISRFSKRAAGTSRTRERVQPRQSQDRDVSHEFVAAEQVPSEEESRLWHSSQRPPTSNPEEGLKRLLQNDVLVIER